MIARCDLCGNDHDRTFEVRMARKRYIFDSFECAIQFLAPTCAHCGCKVIGHGVQVGGVFYCCAHCAKESAAGHVVDRADPSVAVV